MAFFRPEVSVHEVDPDAAAKLSVGIRNLLDLTHTQTALAQVVDNLPIRGHYYGSHGINRQPHPDIESRAAPTNEALTLARELAAKLDPMALRVDAEFATAFQKEVEAPSSDLGLALRFLEMMSSMIHDIFSKIHHDLYPAPKVVRTSYRFGHLEHRFYCWNNAYKHRMASIAGYWAETYIFGGPVLFARGADANECNAAYIHLPSGEIVQLMEHQIISFMTLAHPMDPLEAAHSTILPFEASEGAPRLTISDAVSTHIYRDLGQLSRAAEHRKNSSRLKGWRADGTRSCVE